MKMGFIDLGAKKVTLMCLMLLMNEVQGGRCHLSRSFFAVLLESFGGGGLDPISRRPSPMAS